MVIISKYLVPNGYLGMSIFPFVLLKDQNLRLNKILLNHEKIHLRQQLEMLVIPFFIWYLVEFVIRYIQYKDFKTAYRYISFELEAYSMDEDLNYLQSRKPWAFLNHLKI